MLNIKRAIFFIGFIFFINSYSQFNTILPEKEVSFVTPTLVTNKTLNDRALKDETVIFDGLEIKRKELYNLRKNLSLPIDSLIVTSQFGKRKHPLTKKKSQHYGIDFRAKQNNVYSITRGEVIKIGNDKNLGKYVELKHGDFKTIYGHLHSVLVNIKESVEAGQIIAISGNTGKTTGPHLHFGMKHNDIYIDPLPLLYYIQDLVQFVKTDLSKQIDSELRKK